MHVFRMVFSVSDVHQHSSVAEVLVLATAHATATPRSPLRDIPVLGLL